MGIIKRILGTVAILVLLVVMVIQVSLAEVVNGKSIDSNTDYLQLSDAGKFLIDEDTRLKTTAAIVLNLWEHGSSSGSIKDDFYAEFVEHSIIDIGKSKIYMGTAAGGNNFNLIHVIMFEDCQYLIQTGTLTGTINTSKQVNNVAHEDMENYFVTLFNGKLDPYYEVDSLKCIAVVSAALVQAEKHTRSN